MHGVTMKFKLITLFFKVPLTSNLTHFITFSLSPHPAVKRHNTIRYIQYDCLPLGNSVRVPYRRKQQVIQTNRTHPYNVNMKPRPWPYVRLRKQGRHIQETVTKLKSFLNLGPDWWKWCFMLQWKCPLEKRLDGIQSLSGDGCKGHKKLKLSNLQPAHNVKLFCLSTNSNRKRHCQLVTEWCTSRTQICCIWYNPFS